MKPPTFGAPTFGAPCLCFVFFSRLRRAAARSVPPHPAFRRFRKFASTAARSAVIEHTRVATFTSRHKSTEAELLVSKNPPDKNGPHARDTNASATPNVSRNRTCSCSCVNKSVSVSYCVGTCTRKQSTCDVCWVCTSTHERYGGGALKQSRTGRQQCVWIWESPRRVPSRRVGKKRPRKVCPARPSRRKETRRCVSWETTGAIFFPYAWKARARSRRTRWRLWAPRQRLPTKAKKS